MSAWGRYIRDGWLHLSLVAFLRCRISMSRNPQVCAVRILLTASTDSLSALSKYKEICYEQPRSAPAPIFDFDEVRPASRASRTSQWIADSRSLASRASRRASSATRRKTSRKPTIGAPSDFRRVELPNDRTPAFRPLQLSIYLPGNELPTLPTFTEEEEEVEEEENKAGLMYPAQALMKSRSDSVLSRPSTAFSIPRKPVPSRTFSVDDSRYSMESRQTLDDFGSTAASKFIPRRPSTALSQGTQDFLDALESRLPQLPPALRSKTGPEPVYTLYRRASEQSLRLRTHLEERSQIERRLPECDTIEEEKFTSSKRKGLSPILDRDESTPVDDLLGNPQKERFRSSSSPSFTSSKPGAQSPFSKASPPASAKSSHRSYISQWLLRSIGPHTSFPSEPEPAPSISNPDCSGHQPCAFRNRSSTASSTIYSSTTAADLASPWSTPHSSPHKKNDSVSSYQTVPFPRMSYDWEKKPVVVNIQEASPVGVAC